MSRTRRTAKDSPAQMVLRMIPEQTVVVLERGFKAFPPTLFHDDEFQPEDVRERAAKQAARLLDRGGALGYGIYDRRNYQFIVYGTVPQGLVHNLGRAYEPEDVDKLVRDYAKRVTGDGRKAERELERELKRHDWYAAMSDAPGVWRAGERHMNEVIKPLLAAVPQEVGIALWKKYAPTKSKGGLYSEDPYEMMRLGSSVPSLRQAVLHIASELPVGDATRRELLALLKGAKADNLVDAYSDDYEVRDLHYRDRAWLSPSQWERAMNEALPEGGYNAFDTRDVAAWLKTFGRIKIQPGREGSVVAYVKGDPETLEAMRDEAEDVKADEAGMESDGTLRLWWD